VVRQNEAFDRGRAVGSTMALDEAVEYALS
jgi:hypothetical protein